MSQGGSRRPVSECSDGLARNRVANNPGGGTHAHREGEEGSKSLRGWHACHIEPWNAGLHVIVEDGEAVIQGEVRKDIPGGEVWQSWHVHLVTRGEDHTVGVDDAARRKSKLQTTVRVNRTRLHGRMRDSPPRRFRRHGQAKRPGTDDEELRVHRLRDGMAIAIGDRGPADDVHVTAYESNRP